jgi:hypothetical protein
LSRQIASGVPKQSIRRLKTRISLADGIDVPTLDGQAFPVGFVDNVQRPESPAAIQRVVHEVQGPAPVWLACQVQRLARPIWQPLLATPRQVQAHIAIHPMHTLFVPAAAIKPQAGKTLPKSPAPMPADDGIERFDHIGIPLGCRRWSLVVRRPPQTCNSTGTGDRQSGLNHLFDHLAPG